MSTIFLTFSQLFTIYWNNFCASPGHKTVFSTACPTLSPVPFPSSTLTSRQRSKVKFSKDDINDTDAADGRSSDSENAHLQKHPKILQASCQEIKT